MAKVKETISGRVISPATIEVMDSERSKLIPGQKVLIYKTTGHSIIGASGRVIGEKEHVIGTGEVKIIGNKLIVKSVPKTRKMSMSKIKGTAFVRGKLQKTSRYQKRSSSGVVLIKAIDE